MASNRTNYNSNATNTNNDEYVEAAAAAAQPDVVSPPVKRHDAVYLGRPQKNPNGTITPINMFTVQRQESAATRGQASTSASAAALSNTHLTTIPDNATPVHQPANAATAGTASTKGGKRSKHKTRKMKKTCLALRKTRRTRRNKNKRTRKH